MRLEKATLKQGMRVSNKRCTHLNPLKWLLSSKCGWRLPVYGLILLLIGVVVGYAIGYNQGWENAVEALSGG